MILSKSVELVNCILWFIMVILENWSWTQVWNYVHMQKGWKKGETIGKIFWNFWDDQGSKSLTCLPCLRASFTRADPRRACASIWCIGLDLIFKNWTRRVSTVQSTSLAWLWHYFHVMDSNPRSSEREPSSLPTFAFCKTKKPLEQCDALSGHCKWVFNVNGSKMKWY